MYFTSKKGNRKGEELAKDHYLYDKLRIRPNDYMSAIDCYKAFVALSKHWGTLVFLLIGKEVK